MFIGIMLRKLKDGLVNICGTHTSNLYYQAWMIIEISQSDTPSLFFDKGVGLCLGYILTTAIEFSIILST